MQREKVYTPAGLLAYRTYKHRDNTLTTWPRVRDARPRLRFDCLEGSTTSELSRRGAAALLLSVRQAERATK